MEYYCFANPEDLLKGEIVTISPLNNDPNDYICIEVPGGKKYGITNTCAANALNLIPTNDNAYGNTDAARIAFTKLATYLGVTPEQIARQVIDISVSKIVDYILPMIKEYKLSKSRIVVIGGGGGASVLVPMVAKKLNFEYKKADYADVISSIGVATGMIYEEKE